MRVNSINIGFRKRKRRKDSFSWSSYWTPLSYVVENAAPTNLIVTYAGNIQLPSSSDFAITDHTIDSLSVSGKVLTIVLTTPINVFDVLSLTITNEGTDYVYSITNNVQDDGYTELYANRLITDAVVKDESNVESIYWDLMYGSSQLGDEESVGTTTVYGVYKITATEADHFFAGCAIGDVFPAGSAFTLDENNKVQRVLGNHLTQSAAALKPINGVFDGSNDIMKTAPASINQPYTQYRLFRQITWTLNDDLHDCQITETGMRAFVRQSATTPKLKAYNGSYSDENTDLALNTFGLMTIVANGANSSIQINEGTPVTGDFGALGLGGLSLGNGNGGANGANIEFISEIIRKKADTTTEQANYRSTMWSLYNRGELAWTTPTRNPFKNYTKLASMPLDIQQHGFEACNGKLYVIGGNTQTPASANTKQVYEYDPIANTWATKTPIPIVEDGVQSPILRAVGTKLYFIGGLLTGGAVTNKCFEYEPSTDTWTAKADMPTAREDFGSFVIGTKIYCFGGVTAATHLDVMEVYDTVANTWDETKADLPVAKWSGDFGAYCNGKGYAISSSASFAGYPTCNPVTTVYEYDPIGDAWSTKEPIPKGLMYKECAVLGTDIYVFGCRVYGLANSALSLENLIYKYDTLLDSWSIVGKMPYAAMGIGATVYNEEIYTSGGAYTAKHKELYKYDF